MQLRDEDKNIGNEFFRTCLAIKAARLSKRLTRKEAANLLGWKPVAIERLENMRSGFSKERLNKIISAYGLSSKEFRQILSDPKRVLAETCEQIKKAPSLERKPRRNHYKVVTKEVRVIRTLRKRKGISQYQASKLCGYCPGGFGHIEVGRINLSRERIKHILKSLGYVWEDYESLINSAVLREEVIEEAIGLIHRLDDQALASVGNIIKSLIK